MLQDANQFSRLEHEPQFASGQYTQHLPASGFTQAGNNQCGAQGWYGEETLDVESVHDMAPAANVRFVAAASCQDRATRAGTHAKAEAVDLGATPVVRLERSLAHDSISTCRNSVWPAECERAASPKKYKIANAAEVN